MSLNWTNVKSLAVPVGGTARDVKRVSIGGAVVWEKNATPTARDYVRNDMTRFFDGIENAGFGTHGQGGWVDLITGNVADIGADSAWTENCLRRTAKTNNAANMAFLATSGTNNKWAYFKTIEIVGKITTSGFVLCEASYSATRYGSNQAWNSHAYVWSTGGLLALGHYSVKTCPIDQTAVHTYTFTQDLVDGTLQTIGAFVDGVRVDGSAYNDYWSAVGVTVGGTQANRAILGDIYGVRGYDSVLADAEIAANYAIDKERFNLP